MPGATITGVSQRSPRPNEPSPGVVPNAVYLPRRWPRKPDTPGEAHPREIRAMGNDFVTEAINLVLQRLDRIAEGIETIAAVLEEQDVAARNEMEVDS